MASRISRIRTRRDHLRGTSSCPCRAMRRGKERAGKRKRVNTCYRITIANVVEISYLVRRPIQPRESSHQNLPTSSTSALLHYTPHHNKLTSIPPNIAQKFARKMMLAGNAPHSPRATPCARTICRVASIGDLNCLSEGDRSYWSCSFAEREREREGGN